MKYNYNLICIIFLLISSCSEYNSKTVEQVYPNFDYDKINKVIILNEKVNSSIIVTDSTDIKKFRFIMNDRNNYFPNDSIILRGVKPIYSIKLYSIADTLDFMVFPVKNKPKIELAFFDKYDSGDHNKFRKLNRFYMKSEFLERIKKMENGNGKEN